MAGGKLGEDDQEWLSQSLLSRGLRLEEEVGC